MLVGLRRVLMCDHLPASCRRFLALLAETTHPELEALLLPDMLRSAMLSVVQVRYNSIGDDAETCHRMPALAARVGFGNMPWPQKHQLDYIEAVSRNRLQRSGVTIDCWDHFGSSSIVLARARVCVCCAGVVHHHPGRRTAAIADHSGDLVASQPAHQGRVDAAATRHSPGVW